MNARNFHRMIDDLVDGELSEADFLLLEAEMHIDAELRQAYYDRMLMADVLGQMEAPENVFTMPPARRINWSAFAAVASLVFATWALLSRPADSSEGQSTTPIVKAAEPTFSGYAVISGQADAQWADGAEYPDNSVLPLGELKLESGMVRVELFSGVMLVIEGNAAFEVHSPMDMTLHRGRLHATVPEPAQGFRVNTTGGQVVDLGTEFALDVTGDQAELHVLTGEVEWHGSSAIERLLEEGEGLSGLGDDAPKEVVSDHQRFTSAAAMEQLLLTQQGQKSESARAHQQALLGDPALLAHYDLGTQTSWSRGVKNLGGVATDGALVAARSDRDRWESDHGALNFTPTGSRVRLNVPGEHQSLTLSCWVKIYSLDRWFNSLFLTDGHDLGEPHWQILDDGRLFFSVKKRDGDRSKHIFYSPPIWDASMSGQWIQLTTTYDVTNETVRHFVNGEMVSEELIPADFKVEMVRIGAASIGNWSEPYADNSQFILRNLNGSIDELTLLGRAMTPAEVEQHYKLSRP